MGTPHNEERSASQVAIAAAMARLGALREELSKRYLLRLIERASLEEMRALPLDRVARELPRLVGDLIDLAASGDSPPDVLADLRLHAAFLVELRARNDDPVAALMSDCAALQGVLVETLADQFAEEPELISTGVASLVGACAHLQSAVIDVYLQQHARELERQALTDPLTGLWNVRYLRRQIQYLVDLYHRYEQPFAVLLLDVNGLKQVNDSYGHQVGDRVLVQIALALRRSVRAVDTAARIGGDEFCVLAPNQRADSANVLAERLARAIAEGISDPEPGLITASIGVAACPEHGDQAETLLAAADQAMYQAKAAGETVAVAPLRPVPDGDRGEGPAQGPAPTRPPRGPRPAH